MKSKSLIVLMAMSSLLISCKKTNELYAQGAYDSGDFELNYYTSYNNIDKVNISKEETFEIESSETSGAVRAECPMYGQEIEYLAREDQTANGQADGQLLNWYEDNPKTGYGTYFGPTKCLSRINDKFAYGILSKLYDGRVHCDGYYAKSRVQLNKTGFGTFFPMELKNAKYFGVSIRSTVNSEGFKGSDSVINLHFSFYRHITNSESYEKYNVNVNNLKIDVSNLDAHGRFVGFYFDTPTLYTLPLDGIVGVSMSYDLVSFTAKRPEDIVTYGEPIDDMNNKERPHYAIYLYEMLIPDSTWL